MPKFEVTVTVETFMEIVLEAANKEEAEKLAIKKAWDIPEAFETSVEGQPKLFHVEEITDFIDGSFGSGERSLAAEAEDIKDLIQGECVSNEELKDEYNALSDGERLALMSTEEQANFLLEEVVGPIHKD